MRYFLLLWQRVHSHLREMAQRNPFNAIFRLHCIGRLSMEKSKIKQKERMHTLIYYKMTQTIHDSKLKNNISCWFKQSINSQQNTKTNSLTLLTAHSHTNHPSLKSPFSLLFTLSQSFHLLHHLSFLWFLTSFSWMLAPLSKKISTISPFPYPAALCNGV